MLVLALVAALAPALAQAIVLPMPQLPLVDTSSGPSSGSSRPSLPDRFAYRISIPEGTCLGPTSAGTLAPVPCPNEAAHAVLRSHTDGTSSLVFASGVLAPGISGTPAAEAPARVDVPNDRAEQRFELLAAEGGARIAYRGMCLTSTMQPEWRECGGDWQVFFFGEEDTPRIVVAPALDV